MMMPASPGTLFEVIESEFVLEFLAGVLNPPATLRSRTSSFRDAVAGRFERKNFVGFSTSIGHSAISQHALSGSMPILARWA